MAPNCGTMAFASLVRLRPAGATLDSLKFDFQNLLIPASDGDVLLKGFMPFRAHRNVVFERLASNSASRLNARRCSSVVAKVSLTATTQLRFSSIA